MEENGNQGCKDSRLAMMMDEKKHNQLLAIINYKTYKL
jgi:hypothetical protein